MSIDTEIIIYTILDFLAKGVFGAILVGSRESLEGEITPLALLAMAVVGIQPKMGLRRNSMDLTLVEEARMTMHSGNYPAGETPVNQSRCTKKSAFQAPESDEETTGRADNASPPPPRLNVRDPPSTSGAGGRGIINVGNPLPSSMNYNDDELTKALLAALQSPTIAAKLAAAMSPTFTKAQSVSAASVHNSRAPSPSGSRRNSIGGGPSAANAPAGGLLSAMYGGNAAAYA